MPVSAPVRAYYAARIFALSTRTSVPANFRPLEGPASGRSAVEGCAGGGKNLLEVSVRVVGDRVEDVRAACGLCNPAMYVAADLVCDRARGRSVAELLAVDVLDVRALAPWFEGLGPRADGRGVARPDDAREKLQYALLALQQALRVARGEPVPPAPKIPPPRDDDHGDGEGDGADEGGANDGGDRDAR